LKIYFAGSFDREASLWALETNMKGIGLKRYLITYAELMKETDSTRRIVSMFKTLVDNHGFEYFLDSGAFSVFQQNATIDIDRYIDFIRRHRTTFKVVAALDVIGSGYKSYQNYLYMYDNGVKDCVPAWHYGDDKMLIKKYLDKTDYIAIGNLVPLAYNPGLRAKIIRQTIDIIRKINSKAKVHLYGVTSLILLKMFGPDVESVDSTSWLAGRRFATIYNLNGDFHYNGRIPRHQGLNSHRLNVYNATKFLEIERWVNEQKQRKEEQISVKHP
jgi:hypothetical protein